MIAFYTFRTFPKSLLKKLNSEVFIFGKLHQDLKLFHELISKQNPEFVIGFALSDHSRQESVAVNNFNAGVIEKHSNSTRTLKLQDSAPFPISAKPTHSFCNWTMYKLAENNKTSFFHLKEEDVETFMNWANVLVN